MLPTLGQDGRWVLGARYQVVLCHSDDSWRTTELTLTVVWGESNQNLLAVAAARGAGTPAEATADGRLSGNG